MDGHGTRQRAPDGALGDGPTTVVPHVPVQRWRLARHVCLAPSTLLVIVSLPVLVSWLGSLVFLWWGFPWVTLVALVQSLFIGGALATYALHAIDGDIVEIATGRLRLTQRDGLRVDSRDWDARAVRVQPLGPRPDARMVLVAAGRRYALGRHACRAEVELAVRQLRLALERERLGASALAPP